MPENPEVTDKVDGEVYVTHINARDETIHVRGIEEPVYLLNDLSVSTMIGTGPAKVLIDRDGDGDLVMSKYEALPTPVASDIDRKLALVWATVAEIRRRLMLDGIGAHTHDRRRVLELIDGLLASAPETDADYAELVNREGGLMETVVFHSLHIATDRFNPDPADPGWSSEMHEDALRDACLAYVQAFLARRRNKAPRG